MARLNYKGKLRKIHQWLGLSSGLLVFIIAITGALYAFQEEILDVTEPFRFVPVSEQPLLMPGKLEQIAVNHLPGKQLHSIDYQEKGRAAIAVFYHDDPLYYFKMYIDPYHGEVLHIKDMGSGFFNWVLDGHMYLWLPHDTGRVVVMSATLIFAAMLLTGFFLWLPRHFRGLRQRIRFEWTPVTRWKRKNWDLHAIVGFYSLAFALIFTITGLVWVLPGFADGWHKWLGGEKSMTYSNLHRSIQTDDLTVSDPMDHLFSMYENSDMEYSSLEIHPPETDSSAILVVINPEKGTYWKSDYIFHDVHDLSELTPGHIWGRFDDAWLFRLRR